MDWTKAKKRNILYEDGTMLIWQYPVVLYEIWAAWVCSFLQENPPEEENDKIYQNEETVFLLLKLLKLITLLCKYLLFIALANSSFDEIKIFYLF